MSRPAKYDWDTILPAAVDIVMSYDTPVTLRQLFYRLVSTELLPNTQNAYKSLSARTAELRRQDAFPDLSDRMRSIHEPYYYHDTQEALHELARDYRRDRTERQKLTICIGVEKNGLVEQLTSWFDAYGLPVLALAGYASQSYVAEVRAYCQARRRPAVLLYAGDFDPSGLDIQRDFVKRTDCFSEVVRVALTWRQVEAYDLPPLPGKVTDSRAAAFARRHGELVQVELDALPPDVLHGLYGQEVAKYWDTSAYAAAMEAERRERAELAKVAA